MKVLKFGGSSVGNAENIGKVVEIVKKAIETDVCFVVLSAMQGTTDALLEIGHTAGNQLRVGHNDFVPIERLDMG